MNRNNKFIVNIIYTLFIPFILFWIGMIFNFTIWKIYELDTGGEPLIIQFFLYLSQLFTTQWGNSVVLVIDEPVSNFILRQFPRTLELMIFPTLIGIFIGLILCFYIRRTKYNWIKILNRIFTILVISIPIFVFGIILQYFLGIQSGIFPLYGYKLFSYTDPPLVSGFYVIDALIAGQFDKIIDYIYHLFLPCTLIFLLTTFLTIKQMNYKLDYNSKEHNIASFSLNFAIYFGLLFTVVFLIDITFGLNAAGTLFYRAIRYDDYSIVTTLIFLTLLLYLVVSVILNIFYSIFHYICDNKKAPWIFSLFSNNTYEEDGIETQNEEINSIKNEKKIAVNLLRSPLFIIGIVITIFFVVISVFPQLITPYSIEETLGIYPDAWSPPDEEHILGTALFGRDVLSLIIYGARTSIILSSIITLIGIIGGFALGMIGRLNKWVRYIILSASIILFLFPSILIMMIYWSISGDILLFNMIFLGLIVIPLVCFLVSNKSRNFKATLKELLINIPLFLALSIFLLESLEFIGINDGLIHIGDLIHRARNYLQPAPHATLFPCLSFFLIIFGLCCLHYGLKNKIPITR